MRGVRHDFPIADGSRTPQGGVRALERHGGLPAAMLSTEPTRGVRLFRLRSVHE